MRVLLDECLPRKLKLELTGHDSKTVPEMGWAGLKNGELLRVAGGLFDAFVTVDRSLPAQQRVHQLPFGVVVLGAPRNDIDTLRPLMARVRAALAEIRLATSFESNSDRSIQPMSDDIANPVMRALVRWAEAVAEGRHTDALAIAEDAVELARSMNCPSGVDAAAISLATTRGQLAGLAPADVACSFCGASQSETRLVAGPNVFICEGCVRACREQLEEYARTEDKEGEQWQVSAPLSQARCSFCGRRPADVVTMLAAESGAICDRCVGICSRVLFGDPS